MIKFCICKKTGYRKSLLEVQLAVIKLSYSHRMDNFGLIEFCGMNFTTINVKLSLYVNLLHTYICFYIFCYKY